MLTKAQEMQYLKGKGFVILIRTNNGFSTSDDPYFTRTINKVLIFSF